jgi:hypothetical protein
MLVGNHPGGTEPFFLVASTMREHFRHNAAKLDRRGIGSHAIAKDGRQSFVLIGNAATATSKNVKYTIRYDASL